MKQFQLTHLDGLTAEKMLDFVTNKLLPTMIVNHKSAQTNSDIIALDDDNDDDIVDYEEENDDEVPTRTYFGLCNTNNFNPFLIILH